MFRKTLVKNAFITVEVDITTDILFVKWIGAHTEQTVTEGFTHILEQVQSQRTGKVFNDSSEMIGNWSGATVWGTKVWLPDMHVAGCKFLAWVLPQDLYSQLSAQEIINHQTIGLIVLNFDEPEPALNWLHIM